MVTPKLLTAGIVTLLLSGFACSQRVEPEEEYARRERERPLLPASAAPPALVTGSGGGGPVAGAMPSGPAEIVGGSGGGTAPAGPGVSGTIQAPGLAAPPAGAVLFVIVRPADRAGGPPLAVRRLTPSAFPVDFEVGPQDAMMGGGPFPDQVTVEARLDGDGDPLSRGPDDRSAGSVTVQTGATGVTLRLDAGG